MSAQLLVFLPLFAAIIAGFGHKIITDKGAQFVTCLAVIISAVLSAQIFIDLNLHHGEPQTITLLKWISSGDFTVDWALRLDQLTAIMLVVVTWVSAVVHVYSVGYMSHDPDKARFMAYLSLFTFAMLMLVTADNLIQMYFGWEGVGVASYLLIGFWNHKPSANKASIKAFVVNRVGDFGFALGIATVFVTFHSVAFDDIFQTIPDQTSTILSFFGHEFHAITLACFLLFMGAMGKSAQLGLHTWLPDAMEGPTPVSALIHAATMVTAGVFMVARLSPLFEQAPAVLEFITVIGALTAFIAATIALTQNDIKRVIAYSTMSQLGYMFFALGVTAYGAAMFHLFTHAFFKALLFLGAGSVIHALSDEQDMRKMGGIYKKIPVTYVFMWIGSLALVGLPVFAGYYSKDMILEASYASNTPLGEMAFWFGIMAAVMTAFYSWRLIIMTFHGKPRMSKKVMDHIHESPAIMNVPLVVLVLGALFSGMWGYNYFVGHDRFEFWGQTLSMSIRDILEAAHHVPLWVKKLPIVAGLGGIALAYWMYLYNTKAPATAVKLFKPLYTLFKNKWYFDSIYDVVFVRSASFLGKVFWRYGDQQVIDRFGPNGVANIVRKLAKRASKFQSGYIFNYATVMFMGLILLMGYVLYKVMG